jgi:hypothetical protein
MPTARSNDIDALTFLDLLVYQAGLHSFEAALDSLPYDRLAFLRSDVRFTPLTLNSSAIDFAHLVPS